MEIDGELWWKYMGKDRNTWEKIGKDDFIGAFSQKIKNKFPIHSLLQYQNAIHIQQPDPRPIVETQSLYIRNAYHILLTEQ